MVLDVDTQAELYKLKMLVPNRKDWLLFVQNVYNLCPFMKAKGKGRPSNEEIQSSIIGRSGEKSVKGFMENQLEVSLDSWKKWQGAYRYVEENSYLAEIKPSPSSILDVARYLTGGFPPTLEQWHTALNRVKEKRRATQNQDEVKEKPIVEIVKIVEDTSALKDAHEQNIAILNANKTLKQDNDYLRGILVETLNAMKMERKFISHLELDESKRALESRSQMGEVIQRLNFFIRNLEANLASDIEQAA
jgi:hypothetical protein